MEPPCDYTGDHRWVGGHCRSCGAFNGALLRWIATENAINRALAAGLLCGDHYHKTPDAKSKCHRRSNCARCGEAPGATHPTDHAVETLEQVWAE
jgi:hypothetical protein